LLSGAKEKGGHAQRAMKKPQINIHFMQGFSLDFVSFRWLSSPASVPARPHSGVRVHGAAHQIENWSRYRKARHE
jgi:hypothetical protein